MLNKLEFDNEKNEFPLESGHYYGIPLSYLSAKTIITNSFLTDGTYTVEIGDKDPQEYAEIVINNNGAATATRSNNGINYEVSGKSLGLPNDVILLLYDGETCSFKDTVSGLVFPFVTNLNDNEEDLYASNEGVVEFVRETEKAIEHPLFIDDRAEEIDIYEYSPELKEESHNREYTQTLLELSSNARQNISDQLDKIVDIEHIVATFEDNVKHGGMRR